MQLVLGEYQISIRSNRSVIDQTFNLKEPQTTCYEYKVVLYIVFINFSPAYNSVKRSGMHNIMNSLSKVN